MQGYDQTYGDVEKANLAAPLTQNYQTSDQQQQAARREQSSGFRDPVFLLLFGATTVGCTVYGLTSGLSAIQDVASDSSDSSSSDIDSESVKKIAVMGGVLAVVASVMTSGVLGFLMRNAEGLIRSTLVMNIFLTGLFALLAFANGLIWVAFVCLFFTLINWCYMRAVQSRIPFASANLKVACAAVKQHWGVVFVSYAAVLKGVAWGAVVFLCAVGLYNANSSQQTDPYDSDSTTTVVSDNFYTVMFLLCIAGNWGQEVIKNVSHVTTAGAVASWWYDPGRTSVVSGAYCRATTTSLGSVAFGSLIVAFIQALKSAAERAERSNDGAAVFACIARCLLQCLQDVVEYFNRWAFVYVGVYGDSFIQSGKAVMRLFKERGWTAIINDSLIQRTLSLLALAVACVGAGVGAMLPWLTGTYLDSVTTDANSLAYCLAALGFVISLLLSLIMVSVVDSAVATVFVCAAEAPQVLEQNHPGYFYDFVSAWREAHQIQF